MRNLLLLSALCLGAAATSHADTTFNLVNNTFASGATATGSVKIDTTNGVFDSINVTVLSAGTSYVFTGAPDTQKIDPTNTQYFEYSYDAVGASGDILLLDLPGISLVGFAGGNFCSLANLCNGTAGYFGLRTGPTTATADALATGSLAATPEPSSLVLLGTGVVGVVGAARRRFSRPIAESAVSA